MECAASFLVLPPSGSDRWCHYSRLTPSAHHTTLQVPVGDVWEIDFCSRPMLDERGKKASQWGCYPWQIGETALGTDKGKMCR